MSREKNLYQKMVDKIIWLDSYYVHSKYCKGILKKIPLSIDDKVIDIGCGSGWLSREISKIVKEVEVIGLDISEYSIKKTKQVTKKDKSSDYKNLTFKVGDAENISYPDDYFNCATSLYSFSFWNNPLNCLLKIKRILKPNGKLYIIDVYDKMTISYTIGMKIFNFFISLQRKPLLSKRIQSFFCKSRIC